MNSYNEGKLSIRPILPNIDVDTTMKPNEIFQNQSLRPILKLQHDSIVILIGAYIITKKNAYYKLSPEKRPDYIKNNLLADKVIIHELRGLILGMFTLKELEFYIENKSEVNKRIQALLFQRIMSFL